MNMLIGINLVGPLPITNQKNRYIAVVSNSISRCKIRTHFVNNLIQEICERFNVKRPLSLFYHLQTNELVERFNRTLYLFISSVLLAYRTLKQNTTKHTLFDLTYGRTATLPIITNEFKIRNKVLLHRTKAEKQWNGSFFIYEVLDNGSYKLRLDDKILAKVAHGDHLKHYNSRNNPELLIPQISTHALLNKPEDIPQNLEPIVNIQQLSQKLMLALKTIPELSIIVTENHINYTQTEVVTNLAPNSQKYHPYKKNTRSYSGIHLPELLKLALRENLMLIPISIPPNAIIQQKLQLCLNEKSTEYPPIYRYFHMGKTLYERKLELTTANLTKEAIQKQLHNKFKTTAGPTNSHYKLRAVFKLYDLFYICKNVLQNPIFQLLKIQYIEKLTELKFQKFSDQISSIILNYYLEITDSTWTLMKLSLEKEVMLPDEIRDII
ncbi:hypothetical protein G9A89_009951 [Geosiphon pyriformis]|nr:hypothetical protein G9A89_009951 [Geosiphon pyriformis]